MKQPLEISGLKSQVARRLFVLLLLAALIPAGTLALLAYYQVGDALIESSYQRLEQDAKANGMNLVQRLLWRSSALRHAAEQHADPDALESLHSGFSAFEVIEKKTLTGLSASQIDYLDHGMVILQTSTADGAYMLASIPATSRLLKGKLDPGEVWGDENTAEDYCVLDATGSQLYCAPGFVAPTQGPWTASTANQNSGTTPWIIEGKDYLGAYWRCQLQAKLASDGFIMMVGTPKSDVLTVLEHFRRTFPAIILLALALSAWLAIIQIRRQMRPLEQLEMGTRRLADGNFTGRVVIADSSEFANLADSFNRMAAALDRKFHLLQTLGVLDRAILAVSEMDHLVDNLLRHVPLAVPCDIAGVLRFDEKGGCRLYLAEPEPGDAQSGPLSHAAADLPPEWHQDLPWFAVDLTATGKTCLRQFRDLGASHALVFPARVDTHLDSALVLAYDYQLPENLDEITQAGRSLADRLSIAGSSFAWEDKLYRQAHYDTLTGLPNRVMLRDRVEQALLRAERENHSAAVMLIDLDDFKQVNDTLGHAAGDVLLMAVAERLKKNARLTDTVARLGGDEFIILLPDLPKDNATTIANRIAREICTALVQSVNVGSRMVSAPASIGIALFPDNAGNYDELLTAADAAMYESKRHRRGSYQFYLSRMNAAMQERFELAQELREAIERNEFFLVYQPKFDATTQRIVGAEALLRWASPQRGTIGPDIFIPVIDDIGLGSRLGGWVIDAACAQMAAWQQAGHAPHAVSVNVAPAQFLSGEIIGQVRTALAKHALSPECLELEILESMAVDTSVNTRTILTTLREQGVGIALDDFGTGYSSLVYLTQLPATVLKVDRGFIKDLVTDARQQAIVERIISLAKALDLVVVAEGVECLQQMHMLTAMGCDVFQGYLFSKPLPPDDFARLLRATPAAL